jgi:hypothetical protein
MEYEDEEIETLYEKEQRLKKQRLSIREQRYNLRAQKLALKAESFERFKELQAQYLSNEYLIKKHRDLLDVSDENGKIDPSAVSKGLDLAYKLKGVYAPTKNENQNLNVNINLSALHSHLEDEK